MLADIAHLNAIVSALAGATLLAAIARLAFLLHKQRALNESRQHLAVTDELTGLANRRRLLEELEQALAAHSTKKDRPRAWPCS